MDKPLISTQEMLSLQAATGWCAPSEVLYDNNQPLRWADIRNAVSLPDISVVRGGVSYPVTKPCVAIPCPPFAETTLDVEGDSILDQLRMAADDYRRAYRMGASAPIDVMLPADEDDEDEDLPGYQEGGVIYDEAVTWSPTDGETPEERLQRLVAQDVLADRYGNWTRDLVFPQWMWPHIADDLAQGNGAAS